MLSYAIRDQIFQPDKFLKSQVYLIFQQIGGRVILLTQQYCSNEQKTKGFLVKDCSVDVQKALYSWQILVTMPEENREIPNQVVDYLNSQQEEDSSQYFCIENIGHECGYYIYISLFKGRYRQCLLIITQTELTITQKEFILTCITLLQEYQYLYNLHENSSAKLKIVEETLRLVGHSLRHPIGLINLLTECWRQSLPSQSDQEPALMIQKIVSNLDEELNDLLNLGGLPMETQSHLLPDLLQSILKSFQPYFRAKSLNISYPDTVASIVGDRLQLKLLLENLLSNAIYFSPIGGTISFEWQAFCQEVVMKISDQGPGFCQEDLQNIFKPFYSNRENGTGLGMAIARKIVLEHHGSIWVRNRSSVGAEVTIVLPS